MNPFDFPVDRQALLHFFEELWQNSSDPFWIARVVDDDFEIVGSNRAALKIDSRQVPGARLKTLLEPVPELESGAILRGYWRCVSSGETVVMYQEPVLDGQPRLFEAILVPVMDHSRQVTHVWGTAKDLTRFAEAERELKALNEQLEDKIDERTAALNKAMRKLEDLSVTDPLTGLANRRRFDSVMNKELARLKRSSGILSVMMIDIDCFKGFNDTYGHVAGDDCLRKIGAVIKDSISRTTDLGVRYGGEEFLVVLPETDEEGARRVAQRIQEGVWELAIAHLTSEFSDRVTLSIGVVTSDLLAIELPEDLIEKADARLYEAKAAGRNRLIAG